MRRTFFSRELLHSLSKLTCCTAELASWALICWFVPCENKEATRYPTSLRRSQRDSQPTSIQHYTRRGWLIRGRFTGDVQPQEGSVAPDLLCAGEEAVSRRTEQLKAETLRILQQLSRGRELHSSSFLSRAFLPTFHTGNIKKLNFRYIIFVP